MNFSGFHRILVLAGLALVLFFSLRTGFKALNFGEHWDEHNYIDIAGTADHYESLLPGWYNYPSLTYYLARIAIYPSSSILASGEKVPEGEDVKIFLRGRAIFFSISLLSFFFLFLTAREAGLSPVWALFAVAVCAGSFEFSYHSRWMAPDCVIITPAIIVAWLTFRFINLGKIHLLYLAAFFAGITTGTKYPGILIHIFPMLAGLLATHTYFQNAEGEKKAGFQRIILLAVLCGMMFLGFLITTPGAIFDFSIFQSNILYEFNHYQTGHRGYEILNGADFFSKFSAYSGLFFLSGYKWISVVLGLFLIPGIWAILRNFKKGGISLLVFLFLFIAFFSLQKVMIVRNFQILLPFFALLSAYGFSFLFDKFQSVIPSGFFRKSLTFSLYFLVFLLPSLGIYYNAKSANSILQAKNQHIYFMQLIDYVKSNQDKKFLFSNLIYENWKFDLLEPVPANVWVNKKVIDELNSDYFIVTINYFVKDFQNYVEANHSDYCTPCFGPLDVNFNYYPDWISPRILILNNIYARDMPIEFQN